MLFKKSPEKFWDLIASKYAASPISDRVAYERKIQYIKTFIKPEHVVLDIGCGTGTQCRDIAGHAKHVTGIDFSVKLLAIARQRVEESKLENVEFLKTSLYDERLNSDSYDVVMAFYVLHLMEDTDAVIKHIYNLLKPGGFFISETACLGEKNKMTGFLLRILGRLGLLPTINFLTTRQLEQALDSNGFELVDKTRFSTRPDAEFTLIARKV